MRHPCAAAQMHLLNKTFIPNDTIMNSDESLLLLTGPNMGGKSTLLRQTCIAVILAQMGSYVPADSLKMTVFD